jgi:hypothetical protein
MSTSLAQLSTAHHRLGLDMSAVLQEAIDHSRLVQAHRHVQRSRSLSVVSSRRSRMALVGRRDGGEWAGQGGPACACGLEGGDVATRRRRERGYALLHRFAPPR